jgi:hypothetical protein
VPDNNKDKETEKDTKELTMEEMVKILRELGSEVKIKELEDERES